MSQLVFEVTQEEDGGFYAECLPENIHIRTGPPPEPHRSTLDPDRGYYGEAPVGPAGRSDAGSEQ